MLFLNPFGKLNGSMWALVDKCNNKLISKSVVHIKKLKNLHRLKLLMTFSPVSDHSGDHGQRIFCHARDRTIETGGKSK